MYIYEHTHYIYLELLLVIFSIILDVTLLHYPLEPDSRRSTHSDQISLSDITPVVYKWWEGTSSNIKWSDNRTPNRCTNRGPVTFHTVKVLSWIS